MGCCNDVSTITKSLDSSRSVGKLTCCSAIGMNPTSGSAVFTLLGNLGATIIGMVCSFINWYIVDQKTAGIIVFFFLFQMLYFYFAAKYPRFLVAIVAGAITHVLIIGT